MLRSNLEVSPSPPPPPMLWPGLCGGEQHLPPARPGLLVLAFWQGLLCQELDGGQLGGLGDPGRHYPGMTLWTEPSLGFWAAKPIHGCSLQNIQEATFSLDLCMESTGPTSASNPSPSPCSPRLVKVLPPSRPWSTQFPLWNALGCLAVSTHPSKPSSLG